MAIAGVLGIELYGHRSHPDAERENPHLAGYVQKIRERVGVPAQAGRRVTRAQAGIPASFWVHLDLGGEGRHDPFGTPAGFKNAINVNVLTHNSQDKHAAIPLLVQIKDYSNPYPFADRFADRISMQSAPLYDSNVREIERLLRPGGQVSLWIVYDLFKNELDALARRLNTSWSYSCGSGHAIPGKVCDDNCKDEYRGKYGMPKICMQDGRTHVLTPSDSLGRQARLFNLSGDWDPDHGKAECGEKQAMIGISKVPDRNAMHSALCMQYPEFPDNKFAHNPCQRLLVNTRDNRLTTSTGDWDGGAWKGECNTNQYVAGVGVDNGGAVHSILCCAGNVAHTGCVAQKFLSGDRGGGDHMLDWDSGYSKGECNEDQYIAGVSRTRAGSPSSILCCNNQ